MKLHRYGTLEAAEPLINVGGGAARALFISRLKKSATEPCYMYIPLLSIFFGPRYQQKKP
jgi:hypothetical protein